MKIFIKKSQDDSTPITATVQLVSLTEAVNHFDLGLGTLSNPINADAFVNINTPEIATFYNGEEISIEVNTGGGSSVDPILINCGIRDLTKETDLGAILTNKVLSEVFDIEDEKVQLLSNGSISITPEDNGSQCVIGIKDQAFPDTYVAYSITFSLLLKNEDGTQSRYYFIVDPLLKISSNR